MKRSQFDHAIRAAAAVVGESEILVIGSQAIHASLDDQIPETGNETHRYGFPIDYENAATAAKDNIATVAEEAA